MPPLTPHRPRSSSLPTLLSLSKLISIIPATTLFSARTQLKRNAGWTDGALSVLMDAPMEPEDPPDSPIFWWKLGLSVCLVLSGGVFAG